MQVTLPAIVLLPVLAIAQTTSLWPRIILPGDAVGRSFWLLAPEIALIKVEHVEWIGSEIEVTPPQRMVVRLVKVDADAENIIWGNLPEGPTQFYYFANTLSANGYHTILNWLEPGKRYVVFLREDGGSLRAQADVSGFSVRIRSGRHDHVQGVTQALPADAGVAIAYLALTPAADAEDGFASNLQHTYGQVSQLAPPYEIARFLRLLLKDRDPGIRAQACITLSSNYRYRDPCLSELLRSPDENVRREAMRWLRMRLSSRSLITALREDPLSLSMSGRVSDFEGELELFTDDTDATVRQQSCDTLRRLFTSRHVPNCDGKRNPP